MVFYKIS